MKNSKEYFIWNKVSEANLNADKRILKCQPFIHRVYATVFIRHLDSYRLKSFLPCFVILRVMVSLFSGIYLTFKVTGDVPVTHVAANTDFTVPSPSVVTISCNQCFSVNKWLTSGKEREMRVKYYMDEKSRSTPTSRKGSRVILVEYNDCGHIYAATIVSLQFGQW